MPHRTPARLEENPYRDISEPYAILEFVLAEKLSSGDFDCS